MGINEKLKEIKTGLPEFYDFMTDGIRGTGYYNTWFKTVPVDFRIKKASIFFKPDLGERICKVSEPFKPC